MNRDPSLCQVRPWEQWPRRKRGKEEAEEEFLRIYSAIFFFKLNHLLWDRHTQSRNELLFIKRPRLFLSLGPGLPAHAEMPGTSASLTGTGRRASAGSRQPPRRGGSS